jgi:hypothetical protein
VELPRRYNCAEGLLLSGYGIKVSLSKRFELEKYQISGLLISVKAGIKVWLGRYFDVCHIDKQYGVAGLADTENLFTIKNTKGKRM